MIPLRAGSGVWLEDFAGKRYIDGISSWWVNLFGHCNPRINAAVREQLDHLEHAIFAGFTHPPAVNLAEELVRLAPPGLNRCFFADNGSAAIEVAVKMSFHFWRNTGQQRKTRFITLVEQLSRRDPGRARRRQRGPLQVHLSPAAHGRDHRALARRLPARARRRAQPSTRADVRAHGIRHRARTTAKWPR